MPKSTISPPRRGSLSPQRSLREGLNAEVPDAVVLLNLIFTGAGLRAWISQWLAAGKVALLDLVQATDPFMHAFFAGVNITAPGLAVLIVSGTSLVQQTRFQQPVSGCPTYLMTSDP